MYIMPSFPTSVSLAGDANILAISHFRYLEMLLTLREVLNQQRKNLREGRLVPMLFLISEPQLLCISKPEPGVRILQEL